MTDAHAPPAPPPPPAPPARFPPPVAATIDWLQTQWSRYYGANPPQMPERFTRREFGFILWPDKPGPPPFLRHRGYDSAEKLHWYLRRRGPHSAYYSTAFYRAPAEMRMQDKQWLGAELIFDLDADHLAEAEAAKAAGREMPLDEQLHIVKRQFQYLLDEFLFGDFGLDPADVFITFSGGRGYHAHVTDPKLMSLDAKGRREIVDYVTGKVPAAKGSDLPDLSPFIHKRAVGATDRFGRAPMAEYMAAGTDPGWPGRLTRSLVRTLQEHVLDAPRADAHAWLTAMEGIGAKSAEEFLHDFDAGKLERISRGYLEQGKVVKRVVRHVLSQSALALGKGETDEPVTADVKRLIRLPGSLHGKTGFIAKQLAIDELRDFDPFRDTLAFDAVGAAAPVRFQPRFDAEVTLAGQRVRIEEGVTTEIPIAHAVFFAARQGGSLAPPQT